MFALRRQLHLATRRQAGHHWAHEEIFAAAAAFDRPLSHSTLLMLGLGEIGSLVARTVAAMGTTVIGMRRDAAKPPPAGIRRLIQRSELIDTLAGVDVVVLAMPATSDTHHLIGDAELAAVKRTAILVNVGRGDLVDEAALVRALSEGRLAGAGLDTFVTEPLPPDHPLWALSNVLVTPHVAPAGGAFWAPVVDLFLENVQRYRRGEPLRNLVDKRAGY
jgi:phosphoglycerate dehydrogenase-like enzyme